MQFIKKSLCLVGLVSVLMFTGFQQIKAANNSFIGWVTKLLQEI
ncbi:MAG: hypothetical protein ACRCST_05640 [Turicibacter sp.]